MTYEQKKRQWALRREKIVQMALIRGDGSFHIVAKRFGISRQRVQQIVSAHREAR